ncbi:hypothetical protein RRG08_010483 [Elysia crispata]|uniref:Uncharacterized protein n=1 Tax=Elysia crispata TaxID=231223 RepID=A0AAE1ANZ0_9GAST|nr:hypothetical protein RRG08_010483 [Elysia crispata]
MKSTAAADAVLIHLLARPRRKHNTHAHIQRHKKTHGSQTTSQLAHSQISLRVLLLILIPPLSPCPSRSFFSSRGYIIIMHTQLSMNDQGFVRALSLLGSVL